MSNNAKAFHEIKGSKHISKMLKAKSGLECAQKQKAMGMNIKIPLIDSS